MNGPLAEYLLRASKGFLQKDSIQVAALVAYQRLHHDCRKWQPLHVDLHDPHIEPVQPAFLTQRTFQFYESDESKDDYVHSMPLSVQHYLNINGITKEINEEYSKKEDVKNADSVPEAKGPLPIHMEKPSPPPRGVYLFGSVGTGKSMITDLSFDCLDMPFPQKRRLHFHEFIEVILATLHSITNIESDIHYSSSVQIVSKALANETRFLVIDDLQLTDAAHMALICQVLGYLWQYGVVICVTTNRSPDDLFQGEVSSIWSQALIAYLKQLEIVSLHNESFDYRKCLNENDTQVPMLYSNRSEFQKYWDELVSAESSQTLSLNGRPFLIKKTNGSDICMIDFADLCYSTLGPADYLHIVSNFSHIFVSNVPVISRKIFDPSKRFIWFVDAVYESKCKLSMSSPHSMEKLIEFGNTSVEEVYFQQEITAEERSTEFRSFVGEKQDEEEWQINSSASVFNTSRDSPFIFSGEETEFALKRCKSRLLELSTQSYFHREYSSRNSRAGKIGAIPLPEVLPTQMVDKSKRGWLSTFKRILKVKEKSKSCKGSCGKS